MVTPYLPPIAPFLGGVGAFPRTILFAYQEGEQLIGFVERMRQYLVDVLAPALDDDKATVIAAFEFEVNRVIDSVNTALATQTDAVDGALAAQLAEVVSQLAENVLHTDTSADEARAYVDAAVASIINSTIDVTDPVITALDANAASAFRVQSDARNAGVRGVVYAKEFGAVGDDVTDDTAALQAGIDAAYARKVPFSIHNGTFKITAQLRVKSKSTIYGMRGVTVLKQYTPGQAVIVSHNYIAGNGSPTGQMTIRDLILSGETTSTLSHCLIMRDYFSNISNVSFWSAGGNGLHLTAYDSAGAILAGTMVDNRFYDLDARGNKGYGLFFGESDNNKLTDAMVHHAYVSCGVGAPAAIYCGSAAGWKFTDIHTYGSPSDVAIDIVNAYLTDLRGLYMEGGNVSCLRLSKIQKAVTIAGLQVRGQTAAGGAAIDITSKASFVTGAAVNVSGLAISHDYNVAFTAIRLATGTVKVHSAPISKDGAYPEMITNVTGAGIGSVYLLGDSVKSSTAATTLTVDGINLALTSRVQWSGGAPQVIVIPLPAFGTYTIAHGTLAVLGVNNYNGSVAARYRGDLAITSKATTDGWTAYIADLIAASGFTVAPTVTVDKTARTLTVSFTATSATAYGVVSVVIEHG